MFTVCLLAAALHSQAISSKCYAADAASLQKTRDACDASQKDPMATCEAFHTSDGLTWLFVRKTL
jgi:hypothetical protein